MIGAYPKLAIAVVLAFGPAARADEVRYNRDVRPILADACFRCHGQAVQKAGLRLDRREVALKATETGAVPVVPGKPAESELVRRILAEDETERMPPPSARKTLNARQKELLRQWVEQGAPYERHWSFEPPAKAPLPARDPAARNPIDAFLGERLRREGLALSPEAGKETLVRRVTFALTGLPPTPAEVDAFLADPSPKAYEELVDRLLASPRYGEEMARHWLDVARYADTHGLHLDNERQMWPYRDWVVRAFNENQPFDRFTVDQVAGDLLPNAAPDQLVATGFHRCNVTTGEGGSIDAEWVYRNAVERASTAANTWLGLTAGCAVCHDHKYDPLSTAEFYSLYAFFVSAAGPALDGNVLLHEPFVKLPQPAQASRLAALATEIEASRAEVDRRFQALSYIDPADAEDAGAGLSEWPPRSHEPTLSFRAWLKDAKEAPADLKPLLDQTKAGTLPPDGIKRLREHYLKEICVTTRGVFRALLATIVARTKERTELDAAVPGTFVFKETAPPRPAFVMQRGQYDRPGTAVEPNTPAALPPLKKADPAGRATRLDLARWLVAPEHPLTARVAVNRFWQQVFGVGLVKTSGDFGTQGEPPSHPELLDWLAVDFRESGWDVKALVRLLVTSAAFRQTSRITPELLVRDPDNRLLARGPRVRLDAEPIRDNALFVSGLIDVRMGGKGVKPYQPPNIWEPVAFTGSNTRNYQQDTGAALYRRSLYVFLKRTAPPPFMANFDAPSREFACARRERSNTPLQALQLMNDIQHVEAARGLAVRMMTEGGSSPEERIAYGFRVVLARRPEPDELAVLRDQMTTHMARFRADPPAAKQLMQVGETRPPVSLPEPELAALTMVANTLLNLDETLTRN
jgi:hypothetical protein